MALWTFAMTFLAKATCGRNGKTHTFGCNGFATSSNPACFSGSPSSSSRSGKKEDHEVLPRHIPLANRSILVEVSTAMLPTKENEKNEVMGSNPTQNQSKIQHAQQHATCDSIIYPMCLAHCYKRSDRHFLHEKQMAIATHCCWWLLARNVPCVRWQGR